MAETTAIAWAHATFNPWWGCVEVSPACDHCYAREDAKRYGHDVWGNEAPRRFFSDKHWNEPVRWNRKAAAAGERRRVFCASMADVFEERDDAVGGEMDAARARLWRLITSTPHLDWLLLTKRPAGMRRRLPPEIAAQPNVWPGVTVESPEYHWRLDQLAQLECVGPRWVSYEPALAFVDFRPWYARGLAWWVVGGESGGKARPLDLAWVRTGLRHCREYNVAAFVKQLGARPYETTLSDLTPNARTKFHPKDPAAAKALGEYLDAIYWHRLRDRKGGDPAEWPADLRDVREFPRA